MIGTIVFVLVFAGLGLAVLFAAFSGGSRGKRSGKGPSRASRRAVGIGTAVIIIGLGVAVPTLVGVANGTNHAAQAPGGVELDALEQHGRSVFAHSCSQCHTLHASNAVGKVGPNLDVLLGTGSPSEALILDAIAKGRARGQGQMPAGIVDGEDAEAVAAYVAAVAGR